jgi:hypothetical protein
MVESQLQNETMIIATMATVTHWNVDVMTRNRKFMPPLKPILNAWADNPDKPHRTKDIFNLRSPRNNKDITARRHVC